MLSRRRFLLSTAASAPALALARPLTAQTAAKDTLPDDPEPFGIRLEDDIFITESGAKPFPQSPSLEHPFG